MHVRGKAMDVGATYPTGQHETLIRVPRYDFNWQLLYDFGAAKPAPRGTRLEVAAVWDNSGSNRDNPNPASEVRWGEQSWEEMAIVWVTLQIDPKTDVTKLFK
jgi:hypothetical protein